VKEDYKAECLFLRDHSLLFFKEEASTSILSIF